MTPEVEKRQVEARRIIMEMIEAAMELAEKKGPHPLTPGCNCIACVGKRKRLLKGETRPWKYIL
jgi:hypothetical protein